jgi:hypothetical protein
MTATLKSKVKIGPFEAPKPAEERPVITPSFVKDEVRVVPATIKSMEAVGHATPSVEQIARRNRRSRSPIDGRRNILTVKGLAPGMVGRWVDNTPERVEQLMEQGYDVVRQAVQVGDISIDSGAQTGAVTTRRVGGGKEAILMQIPEAWYKADQLEKQKIVDSREAIIYNKGKDAGEYGKVEVTDIVPNRAPRVRHPASQE